MATKIVTSGNMVKISFTDGSKPYTYPRNKIFYSGPDSGLYNIYHEIPEHKLASGLFSDFLDNSDTPYASENAFETAIDDILGSDNGGGVGQKQGFIDYNDTTGAVSLTADTWTSIPNNGLGAFTNKTYKPNGVTEFMDTSTGEIDVSEISLGDTILIRNDYTINPNTNNALLEFRYVLGTGGGAYTLESTIGRLDNGSGKDYRYSLKIDEIYMGDSNTKDNPIGMQVRLSTNGTLINAGSVIQLIKGRL